MPRMQATTASLCADPSSQAFAQPSSSSNRIAAQAQQNLCDSAYYPLRQVSCEYDEGVLTLRGRLPSWYLKQIAQTVVGNLDAVDQVDNRIEVEAR